MKALWALLLWAGCTGKTATTPCHGRFHNSSIVTIGLLPSTKRSLKCLLGSSSVGNSSIESISSCL